jgi:hypothetical protein
MQLIHEGNSIYYHGRLVYLDQTSKIFDCPYDCEYVMTALTDEGILTIRDTHLLTNHPEELRLLRWKEAFEDGVPEYVDRVLYERSDWQKNIVAYQEAQNEMLAKVIPASR